MGDDRMSGEKAAVVDATTKEIGGRQRSTIGFPYMDLGKAIEMAAAIHDHVGPGDCDDDQLAAWTAQSPKASTFRVQMYAARTFGVIEPAEGGKHKLSELGRSIVDPNQAREAKARAFLMVPLHRAIFERYRGGVLPPTAALERDIVSLGVSEKQKGRARQVFERSAEQSGFFEHGKNRLIAPGVGPINQTMQNKDRAGKGSGNGDGKGGPNDPLIQALIQKLPESGPWGADERVTWLKMLAMAFQITYGHELEIEIRKQNDN
jgi:hypothetical protein